MTEASGDNFYQPIEVNKETNEPETGPKFIADPKVAEELAYIEKPDRDATLTREKELAEGLTEVQKQNMAVMEGLQEKYPHAFIEKTDNKGRKYLIIKKTIPMQDEAHIISQEGISTVYEMTKYEITKEIEKDEIDSSFLDKVYKTNFKDANLTFLKEELLKAEELHQNDPVTEKLIF